MLKLYHNNHNALIYLYQIEIRKKTDFVFPHFFMEVMWMWNEFRFLFVDFT